MLFSCAGWAVFGVSCLLLVIRYMFDKQPPAVFSIYARKSGIYWVKVCFMYLMLKLQKIKRSRSVNKQSYLIEVDQCQRLSSHEKAVDAVYFNGANKNGDYFVLGTARRRHRLVDGLLYLKIHDSKIGVLQIPKLPDTSLFNHGEEDSYEAEGIKVDVVVPMNKWKIRYNGTMNQFVEGKPDVERKKFHVKIEGIWIASTPYFNYEVHMDCFDMAKAISYEKWSRNYFDNLKENHTIHYEQFGTLNANITIDQQEYTVNFETLRDHSIGVKREWSQFHRYGLHFFSCENGDKFSLGAICMPVSFSRLNIGWIYCAQDDKVYPVTDLDFKLYNHGELGHPAKDYAFSFKAGSKDYTVQVNVVDSPYFYISKDWEVKIWERLCLFKVNDVKGYGASEWAYRHLPGRNVSKNE